MHNVWGPPPISRLGFTAERTDSLMAYDTGCALCCSLRLSADVACARRLCPQAGGGSLTRTLWFSFCW
ncbi:hypothetical protein EJ06DRAFT_526162 [Trichodelitschia bisporula]|uniref:Uncharacterized protein n=1 Tax=Trichodelitschia bisporula TaxID=703511 RepID=A0A6G1IBI1_9PEZI|nr:hypothetical protein EJ06DRAFT_526162 [Trichodelitschia bisporula]